MFQNFSDIFSSRLPLLGRSIGRVSWRHGLAAAAVEVSVRAHAHPRRLRPAVEPPLPRSVRCCLWILLVYPVILKRNVLKTFHMSNCCGSCRSSCNYTFCIVHDNSCWLQVHMATNELFFYLVMRKQFSFFYPQWTSQISRKKAVFACTVSRTQRSPSIPSSPSRLSFASTSTRKLRT